ncbi:hypothetical protein VE03_02134 [Pseudogymnoascus sp. 23342-1-I1]|nr:hypothetical protein VE03_02134 [Pseudogymnoascus sp. 23342-1-I1]
MPAPVDFSTTGMEQTQQSSKEATCSCLPGWHETLAPLTPTQTVNLIQPPLDPRHPPRRLPSPSSYSTRCDRRTPANESQRFLAEPAWPASDDDACFREATPGAIRPIFHSEKSSVAMRRGVLSSYLRHIEEWAGSLGTSSLAGSAWGGGIRRHRSRKPRNDSLPNSSMQLVRSSEVVLEYHSPLTTTTTQQFRRVMASKGPFNSAIPEEASAGQAHHDSPPAQSNGANRTPISARVPRPRPPALSAAFLREKEEPRLSW